MPLKMSTVSLLRAFIFASIFLQPMQLEVTAREKNDGKECESPTDNPTEEGVPKIFRQFWEWRLLNAPEFATFIGVHKYDHRLDEMSLGSYLRREDEGKLLLEQVKMMRRHTKSPSTSSNLELLESELNQFVSGQQYQSYLWPMNMLEGPQIDFPRLISWMKTKTKEDLLKVIQRTHLFPQQIDESIALMKEGIRVGITMHSISIQPLVGVLKKMAIEAVERSSLFKPFEKRSSTISEKDWKQFVNALKLNIKNKVQPAYLRLAIFIEKDYLGHTRSNIGVTSLPNGLPFYKACLKYHTSTNLTAEEIHKKGKDEVNRIEKRMEVVKDQVKFNGTLKQFRKYVRNDPKFNYSSGDEIIKKYKKQGKIIQKLLPKFFSVLPKTPYQIIPIPASVAPSFPGAFYLAPSSDGSRPGTFYINTYKPESRKQYEAVSLSLHEAQPGHHLQGALAIEQGSSLDFRRFMDDRKYYEPPASFPKYTAYVEGWGLYSEFLGEEMGVYGDDYDMFGRLSHEMLRACRLVVDTGMHALGWSRTRSIQYMKAKTALGSHDIEKEIDRYITWPGQACGYKIGELKIKEVRKKAERLLGDKFDTRKFHTLIATLGGVPLDFMERQVDKFIKEHS